MPLPRTPLPVAALSDAAKKALGAGPLKMMAARGLAPLPKPADLASVIYQLTYDAEAPVAAAADKTAGELPEKVLAGALSDPALDRSVIDFFAGKVLAKPALVEAILLNQTTADETIGDLAAKVGEREIDIIATNEQRLLRAPFIIGAMYKNPKARMSTVDRAVELAVRNDVTVPGIPAWSEIVAAVLGLKKEKELSAAEKDVLFREAAAVAVGDDEESLLAAQMLADDLPEEAVDKAKGKEQIDRLSIPSKLRLATLGNAFARALLIRDINRLVAMATIRSPSMTDEEVVKFSANRSLSQDVIREIAGTKEWTKINAVRVNLVNNPKCPLPNAMRLLPLLNDRDIRMVAKSRSVPSAVVNMARNLLDAKDGSKKK